MRKLILKCIKDKINKIRKFASDYSPEDSDDEEDDHEAGQDDIDDLFLGDTPEDLNKMSRKIESTYPAVHPDEASNIPECPQKKKRKRGRTDLSKRLDSNANMPEGRKSKLTDQNVLRHSQTKCE